MNLVTVLGVSVFGGLGALTRSVQDTVVKARFGSEYPWGTMTINIAGGFLLGLITGLAMFAGESEQWRIVLGAGFCGGYTTFSTAMFEAAALLRERRWPAALVNLFGTLAATLLAAALGLWLASL